MGAAAQEQATTGTKASPDAFVVQDQQPKQTQAQSSETVEGRASWYGPGFYGRKTTSGEVLEKGTMTAAHSSLPMGTKVKVTRTDTGKSVTVVINDRKPFKPGTVIDLAPVPRWHWTSTMTARARYRSKCSSSPKPTPSQHADNPNPTINLTLNARCSTCRC